MLRNYSAFPTTKLFLIILISIFAIMEVNIPVEAANNAITFRTTPNTLVVNSNNNPGDGNCDINECTLQEAIESAQSGDTIIFNLSYPTTITIDYILIDKDIFINGPGADNLIINGSYNSQGSLFGIYINRTVSISGLTFSNGRGFYGGAIENSGSVSLTDCIFSKNSAGNSFLTGGGGAIYNKGTMAITNSIFLENHSDGEGGGAIFNKGSLSLTNSTLDGNSTNTAYDSYGGAIFNDGSLSIINSLLIRNSVFTRGYRKNTYGGAIYNLGNLTISESTISENYSVASYGIDSFGGGIFNEINAALVISNSTIAKNNSNSPGGIYNLGILSLINDTISESINSGLVNYGVLHIANTIIANSAFFDCANAGTILTNINNLVEDGSCSASFIGDPKLGEINLNEGGTQTYAPLIESPIIDMGDDSICNAEPVSNLDQRGIDRPQGRHCDIGSYELIDNISPVTYINTLNPDISPTNSTSMSFSFSGIDSESGIKSFECTIDEGIYEICISPKEFSSLKIGLHTISVRAVDLVGNKDINPVTYAWTIDSTALDTEIITHPTNPTNSQSAHFTFSSQYSSDAIFECSLDHELFSYCTNPKDYTNLANGSHTFEVRASDLDGHFDATPALYEWEIDLTSPIVASIVRATPILPNATSVNFIVTFTKTVTGLNKSNFMPIVTGSTGAKVIGVNGSGTIYTVTVNIGADIKTLRLDLIDDDTILDVFSNPLGGIGTGNGTFTTGETYVFTRPTSKYVAISSGYSHTCALTYAGGVQCWGYGWYGQLGNGKYIDSNVPVDVIGLTSNVSSISAGDYHTCAVLVSGAVKCWGKNGSGELGNGYNIDRGFPQDVIGLGSGISTVSAGESQTCALTSAGGVKCWGYGYRGDNGDRWDSNYIPVDVVGLSENVRTTSASSGHTCVVQNNGKVKCWGDNTSGQLGTGTVESTNTPMDVVSLPESIRTITVGASHTCALTVQGGVKCWGGNLIGQLGNGTSGRFTDVYTPMYVTGLTSGVNSISARGDNTCILNSSGGVKCWGANGYGQLGNGTRENNNLPSSVISLNSGIHSISIGSRHSCAITSSGIAKCWGAGWYGELGDGINDSSLIPVTIGLPRPFSKKSPSNYSNNQINPTLTWEPSPGATKYQYCIDQVNHNPCMTWIDNGTSTTKTLTNLLPGKYYYWNIRAINGTGISYSNTNRNNPPYSWGFRTDYGTPRVVSIIRKSINPTTSSAVQFTVTFSLPVYGVDMADFFLTKTGLSGTPVIEGLGTSDDTIYTVNVFTASGSGTLRLDLKDNDSIKGTYNNTPLGGIGVNNGNFTLGQKYTLDRDNRFNSSALQDGWMLEIKESGNIGGGIKTSGNLILGDDASKRQYRSLLSFDTSSLPDNATIVKVTLKARKEGVAGTDPFTWTGNKLMADIRKGYFGTATTLHITDFQAPASKAGIGPLTNYGSGWYQVIFKSSDFTNINLKGLTQFRMYFSLDDNNNSRADYATFYAGDALLANRPTLIVEYTLP